VSFDVPPPHPELARLEPLLGRWRTEEKTEPSVLGPGVPVTSNESFYWLDGGYFLVSTYETKFGDEPVQKGVNYWGYDADPGRYRIVFFSNNGPFSEEGNQYFGRIEDGGLVFEGPARFRYELDEDGRVRVNPAGTITVQWWLRDETGDWKPWMKNTFEKVED